MVATAGPGRDAGGSGPLMRPTTASTATAPALAAYPDPVSLKELSKVSGLHPSTAHRILDLGCASGEWVYLANGGVGNVPGILFKQTEADGGGWWQPLDRIDAAGLPTLYRRAAESVLAARSALAA